MIRIGGRGSLRLCASSSVVRPEWTRSVCRPSIQSKPLIFPGGAEGPGGPIARRAHRAGANCFTPGTMIATPGGTVAVETLAPGDMVLTRDSGPQEIRWVGRQDLTGPRLRLDTGLQPVLIRAGALGPGMPERDLLVSPNHRVLLLGDHPALGAREAEVLVSARHLVGARGISRSEVREVSYLHFMCDRHEVVLSNGAWTESFQPSADALMTMSDRAREELLALFPELAGDAPPDRFGAARRVHDVDAIGKLRV